MRAKNNWHQRCPCWTVANVEFISLVVLRYAEGLNWFWRSLSQGFQHPATRLWFLALTWFTGLWQGAACVFAQKGDEDSSLSLVKSEAAGAAVSLSPGVGKLWLWGAGCQQLFFVFACLDFSLLLEKVTFYSKHIQLEGPLSSAPPSRTLLTRIWLLDGFKLL